MAPRLCGLMLYAMCVDNWTDPPSPVTLDVTSNATSPMRVGQVVQFNCTGHLQRSEATLVWYQVIGPTELRLKADHSVLTYTKTLAASDHGTELYCGTWFSRTISDGHSQYYYAKSKRIPIRLQGVIELAKPLNRGGESVRMVLRPAGTSFNTKDTVSWSCVADNVKYGFMQMRQVKGIYERNIHSGYQLGDYRLLDQQLKPSDNDTYIYCTIYMHDFDARIGYSLNGPPVYIKMES